MEEVSISQSGSKGLPRQIHGAGKAWKIYSRLRFAFGYGVGISSRMCGCDAGIPWRLANEGAAVFGSWRLTFGG
jgi:hypothetical protein